MARKLSLRSAEYVPNRKALESLPAISNSKINVAAIAAPARRSVVVVMRSLKGFEVGAVTLSVDEALGLAGDILAASVLAGAGSR